MRRAGSCVALVCDDRELTEQVQSHLKKQLGWPAFECSFDAVRDHLTCDSDGLLLLGVVRSPDQAETRRLVQDVSLQKLPVMVVLLDGRAEDSRLGPLDAYVTRRLYSPAAAAPLTSLARGIGC